MKKRNVPLTSESESAIIKSDTLAKQLEFDFVCRTDFEAFLKSIPAKDRAKLLATILNTEIHGMTVAIKMQWVKKIETDLYELRSKQGNNIQRALYFHKMNNVYVITHGFTKKRDRTPETEKEKARALRAKYMKEDKNNEQD